MIEIKRWDTGAVIKTVNAESLRDADLGGADLRGADLGGADLGGADLGGADLGGADLGDADLGGAYLGGAYLGGAYLGGAYLGGAYLRGADLRGAYLGGADLRGAYLGDADLGGADLRGAYLGGADLRGAYLGGADLRGADLRGVRGIDPSVIATHKEPETPYERKPGRTDAEHMARFRERHPEVPIVEDLDHRIYDAVTVGGGSLDMGAWHTCATTHCRAGWAITLAGEAGKALEERVGPAVAGRMIYLASTGRSAHFFATTERALADMKKRAEAGR